MNNLSQLLEETSRTFGLAIPLLPEPARTEVTVAYLVLRIADTFEDAPNWAPKRRLSALSDFRCLLETSDVAYAKQLARLWCEDRPTESDSDGRLVRHTAYVLGELASQDAAVREIIVRSAVRTIRGMEAFLNREVLEVQSLGELRQYCFYVAGIVGEMLTEIFAHRIPKLVVTRDLRLYAQQFGEGLQLVNILKDSAADAAAGRCFIPSDAKMSDLFAIARNDLSAAKQYTAHLRSVGAPGGYLRFTRLPTELAEATLLQVEMAGPGAKVPRPSSSDVDGH